MSMLTCPTCGAPESEVVDSRSSSRAYDCVRRRRRCKNCGDKFTTYEVTAKAYLNVLQQSGKINDAREAMNNARVALTAMLEMVPEQKLPEVWPVDP